MPEPEQTRATRRSLERLLGERAQLMERGRRQHRLDLGDVRAVDDRIRAVQLELLRLVGPVDASPDLPLVLLPVRLETRFDDREEQVVLRVRIYPDDVHLDGLERGLTETEQAAGRAWWHAAWTAPETGPARDEAFALLVATVGPHRAEWVARATTPLNLAQRAPGGPGPEHPAPVPPLGRGPLARALPDRFVAIATQGGTTSRAVGEPVPPDLQLSPAPTLEGFAPVAAEDELRVAQGSEWLVDYEAAKAVGMAIDVPLRRGTATVDRLVVIGTRAEAGQPGADELEDLLLAHRFSEGLGLLPQGTPTNNSDADRSPYRPSRPPEAPPASPPAAAPGSDTAALAHQLGVDATLLTGLLGDGTGEQTLAGQVNTALWGAGWGTYLSMLEKRGVPGTGELHRDRARRLFGSHVRGRGPAPALRVGPQPYGVLPVSDLGRWRSRGGELGAGVAHVVHTLLPQWLRSAEVAVPRVRPGQSGLGRALLEVLGSGPVMTHLRARPELDDAAVPTAVAAMGLTPERYQREVDLTTAVGAALLGTAAGRLNLGSFNEQNPLLPLPLVSPRDDEFIGALLASAARLPKVDSVLQALVHLSWQYAADRVHQVATVTTVPDLVAVAQLEAGTAQQLVNLVPRIGQVSAAEYHSLADALVPQQKSAAVVDRLVQVQPVASLAASAAEVTLSAAAEREAPQLAAGVLAEWLRRRAYQDELSTALAGLLGADLEARRLAVAETLDLSSHRLDAWATAVVTERRARQVQAGHRRGLTLGAYGVVEKIVRDDGRGPDGWIHAPSPEHATAAGVLRSAHLSHLGQDGNSPFALDLASGRARAADRVLDGVRSGQQLAELIGYQIERDLVARRLGRFQVGLRTVAPLVARRLTDRPGSSAVDSAAAQESIAATSVVDGLLLLQRHDPDDPAALDALCARLGVRPENAYLGDGEWPPVSVEERDRLRQVLRRAADTVDAVADVLLAEGVLQHTSGNPARAAAAMDVMGAGGPVGEQLDVLQAHDSGRRLTHAALVVLGEDLGTRWNPNTPRAVAEPRLEAWASAHLGRPHDVVVAVVDGEELTLDRAGLAALDLVHGGEPAQLEPMLRAVLSGLGDQPLLDERDPDWPAGRVTVLDAAAQAASLRALVAGAQAVTPASLRRADEDPVRDLTAALPELAQRMEKLAAGLSALVTSIAGRLDALVPPDGQAPDQARADAVAAAVHELDAYGIPLSGPPDEHPLDLSWALSALQAAQARAADAEASVRRARGRRDEGDPATEQLEAWQDVGTGVLGDGFLVLPVLPAPTGGDPFVHAVQSPAFPQPPASAVRRFVQDHATVRTGLRRWSETRLLADALGRGRPWTVAQLAEVGDDLAPGTDRWLAGALPAHGPWPDEPVTHLVLEVHGRLAPDGEIAGLVVDGWVEDLPDQPGTQADREDPQPDRARTGLAVHAGAASARPPQALLCAVSPDGSRWTEDSVRGVVEQTLDLARARMVTLERMTGQARVLPALYVRHWSLQGKVLSWKELATLKFHPSLALYVKDLPR